MLNLAQDIFHSGSLKYIPLLWLALIKNNFLVYSRFNMGEKMFLNNKGKDVTKINVKPERKRLSG